MDNNSHAPLPEHWKMSLPSLTIKLFGPLQILIREEPLARLRPRSVEGLLALLILRQGGALERSWLAGTLWPNSDDAQARHNLRNALLVLRRALGSESACLQSPTRSTLRFDLSSAEIDVIRFDRAIQTGETAALREAVALYSAPLLEGYDEVWITQERYRREQNCLTALEILAAHAEDREEAVRYLWWAQSLDPLHEPSVRQLMILLAKGGDAAGAVEVYREFRARLHEELNASPSTETWELFQHIREQGRSPINTRRLSGDTRQTTVSEPTAPLSVLRVMARIPHALSSLIGRTEELETLQESLRQNRLVTLVGTGGVGKTRLAMAVAEKVEARFARRAVWVELAPLTQGALILPTLAEVLGLSQDERSDPERLHAALVSHFSQGDALLVLDNCEHLLDPVADVVQRLLLLCPLLSVLATSRQHLGVKGEIVWRVASLSAPGAEELSAASVSACEVALNYPAVRLFLERAKAARTGFTLKRREEIEAVCLICRRLDGIPLALELAAARTNVLSVEQIAKRLDNRFRLLTEGSRSDPPRHRTLRALIDWSYDQLSDAERALLCWLSVFAGGWSLEATEAVFESKETPSYEMEDALDVLSALVNRSLVLTEEHDNGLRYRMLETIREYALEKLCESGEERHARERHADFFLALAEEAKPFVRRQERDWLKRLDTEHDNLRGALTYFLGQEETLSRAVHLTAVLANYWSMRVHTYEERHFLIPLARRPAPWTEAHLEIMDYAATSLGTNGEQVEAEQMYREMLAAARQLNFRRSIAKALNGLAWTLIIFKDEPGYNFSDARTLAEESLSIARELEDKREMTHSLFRLSSIVKLQGDLEAARTYLTECRMLDQELGVKGGMAMLELGCLALKTGDYAEAKRCICPFLLERLELEEHWGVIYGLFNLGNVALEEHDWERAARLLGASYKLKEALLNPFDGYERTVYDPLYSALNRALGEAACVRLWAEGAGTPLSQMIAYATETVDEAISTEEFPPRVQTT